MRILSVHNRYLVRGGEEESTEAERRLLRQHGHEVEVYEEDNHRVVELGRIRTAARAVWSVEAFKRIRRLLRRWPADVVHVQNWFPLISPSAYYAARAEGVPVVQTLRNYRLLCVNGLLHNGAAVCERCMGRTVPWHGVSGCCYRASCLGSAAVAAMVAAHRAMGTWFDLVNVYVALTEFARRKYIRGGLPAEKIVVKPNFVDSQAGVGDGAGGYALLVSRLTAEKGVSTALSAWRRKRAAIVLKIVGDGPLESTLRHLSRDMREVQWLGRKTRSETEELMKGAAFLVFPSEWYETFGRVVVEAFAAGTPVIGSRIGAIAELLDDGRTGLLFRPGDPSDLAEKVDQMLSSPARLVAMRQSARREYERHYTAERNYRMLRCIYEAAIAGDPPVVLRERLLDISRD